MSAPADVGLLARRVDATAMRLRREGIWPAPLVGYDWLGFLIVGPDHLEDVTEFQGCAVVRVDHWPGEPCVGVPAGESVASAYEMARRIQRAGVDASVMRAFGPPGWEHVSLPLVGARGNRVDFVPANQLGGPMIGVELT